ncbi:MAG: 3-deoxy-manno-octulosonate cytidylyltransferase [Crocinitomicaceae bacterium]
MKVLGVIPARYGSSRFPGKPLIDLKGKSMIRRVYEGALQSQLISELIVATDDDRIVQEVRSFNGNVLMTSDQHRSGTDRCGEVASKHLDVDVVINIQGDEPLVDSQQLDSLLKAFEDPDVQIATLGIQDRSEETRKNDNRIKLVKDANGDALYFSRCAIPHTDRASDPVLQQMELLRHIGVYAFRRETLLKLIDLPVTALEQVESLEQLRWMYHGYKVRVVETTIETPNIDAPEDIEEVLNRL